MAPRNSWTTMFRGLSKESFRQAGFSISSQKLRSFLTLLGIIIGVAPVIALVGIMAGFTETVNGAFSRLGTSVVTFQKYDYSRGHGDDMTQQKRRDLTFRDAEALARAVTLAKAVTPEVNAVMTPRRGTVKNEQGQEANDPSIRGAWASFQQVRNMPLEDGRFFSETDVLHRARVCVIGSDVAKALFRGKDPMGRRIMLGPTAVTVVGTMTPFGGSMGDGMDNFVLLPITTWGDIFPDRLLDNSGAVSIAMTPKDPAQQEAMIDQAIAALRVIRGLKASDENDFHFTTAKSEMATFNKVVGGIAAGVILVAAMALLVGGVGVMNIMLVSVTERTREIGIRKAMGATRRDILAQFLLEAVALTCVGGLVGLGIGMGGALLVRVATPIPASAPLWSGALGFGVSAAVGLTFGLWPAMRAAKQDPIEALRYE